jgi:Spy/CpxP family protein refolding chaperone
LHKELIMPIHLRSAAAAAALLAAAVNLGSLAHAGSDPDRLPGCPPDASEYAPHRMHPLTGMPGPSGMGGAGHPHGGFGQVPPWRHVLQLTDAQQDQVFGVLHDREPALRDAFKGVRAARMALRRAALQAGTTATQLPALSAGAGQADATLALLMAQTDQQLLTLLTPAQQERLQRCVAPLQP